MSAEDVWSAAAERGSARLTTYQDGAGRWEGEVVWCPIITAQVVLAYAPDRLNRRYAYQILLIEELARHGVETRFVFASTTAHGL